MLLDFKLKNSVSLFFKYYRPIHLKMNALETEFASVLIYTRSVTKRNRTSVINNLFQFQPTKLHIFPFKVIHLEFNSICHFSLSLFYTPLEGLFFIPAHLMASTSSKQISFNDPLELGKKKMSHSAKLGKKRVGSNMVMFLSNRNCHTHITSSYVLFQTCLDLWW